MSGVLVALGIALAGGLGAAARFVVEQRISRRRPSEGFPRGVLVVNVTGSFALGLLTGAALADPLAGILATGFLGGYTTFSTASLDTVRLLRERRIGAALLNGPGVLFATVAVAVLGILLTRP